MQSAAVREMPVPAARGVSADEWHARFYLTPPASDIPSGVLRVRRFVATSPDMDQPPLLDDLVCLHLGGAKRVHRKHSGRVTIHDVPAGALTIMPKLQRNRWRTIGPINFVHITLSPGLMGQVAVEEFGVEPATVCLEDEVGFRDPLLEALGGELAATVENSAFAGRLYTESLLVAFAIALLKAKSRLARRARAERPLFKGGLAAWRLRHVTDYIETYLADDFSLSDLTALSGLSRAQFFRAFRQSTGASPADFVRQRRVGRAQNLLLADELSLSEIAKATGFGSRNALGAAFRSVTGTTPKAYRTIAR